MLPPSPSFGPAHCRRRCYRHSMSSSLLSFQHAHSHCRLVVAFVVVVRCCPCTCCRCGCRCRCPFSLPLFFLAGCAAMSCHSMQCTVVVYASALAVSLRLSLPPWGVVGEDTCRPKKGTPVGLFSALPRRCWGSSVAVAYPDLSFRQVFERSCVLPPWD